MPPSLAKSYLREFLRILSPRGVLFFQLVSEPILQASATPASFLRGKVRSLLPTPVLDVARSLRRRLLPDTLIHMYGIPRREMEAFIESCDGRVVQAWENPQADLGWNSVEYCVRRSA